MKKSFKIMLRIIFILIVLLAIVLAIYSFKPKDTKESYKEIDSIKGYKYVLKSRDTDLTKENFTKLKEVLEQEEIDKKLYAEYVSKLFIIDLFTLDNKDSKYDVGGKDYILNDVVDNYLLNATDTLYKYLENKDSDNRKNYPEVKSIDLVSIEEDNYTYNKNEYKSYKVTLEWKYAKNLGYPTKGEVTLIDNDNYLYVVSFKGVE